MDTLSAQRHFYARHVTAKSGVVDERISSAFATIRREDFLPLGPWQVLVSDGYIETPTDDPAQLYQDIVVALDADRGINNGEPSLHARCLNAVSPQAGETVLHVGCGSGYYTALLATLVGRDGHVEALEVVPDLVKQAKANLSGWPNVAVSGRSGTVAPLPHSDIIYVNAGATEPMSAWLEALDACLADLQGRARDALRRVYTDEQSRSDAARALGMKQNGLKTLLQRSKRVLRTCVGRRME